MFKNEDELRKILGRLNIDIDPDDEHRNKLRWEMLRVFNEEKDKHSSRMRFLLETGRAIMKNRYTKLAAAAVIIIALAVIVGDGTGSSAWAGVIKAFNEVKNVHVIEKLVMPDGTVEQSETWLRRSDCIYSDYNDIIVIDNGKEQLFIDKNKRTAQYSDSIIPWGGFGQRYEHFFRSVTMFQSQNQQEYEFKKLEDQSDEKTIVFSLKYESDTHDFACKGKAWVDAVTMLLRKIQTELTGELKAGMPASGVMFFSYEPITDNVFTMVVPEGYTELPRKQSGVMSGRVLDEHEKPVANAVVCAADRVGYCFKPTMTDESGQFIFKLPPEGVGAVIWLPVLFRAFEKDDPNRVAWSIIKDPASKDEPGGEIPYDVAFIDYIDNNGSLLKTANGITLRMATAGKISGQVTDADGVPISNAKVWLRKCQLSNKHGNVGLTGIDVLKWSGPDEFGIVRTDANGRYELNNLPKLWKNTKVFVSTEAEGFAGDTSGFRTVGPIENEKLNIQLYRARLTITGKLIDNYGVPIDEQYIYVIANGKWYRSSGTKTDKNGRFVLEGCPDTPAIQVKAELSHGYDRDHAAKERRYAPDITVPINYQKEQTYYEVEMIAERPELVLNVEVKNTAGELLKYFPVEIRSESTGISTEWKVVKQFERRTDVNGKCKFTEIPNIKDIKLILYGTNTILNEKLSESEKLIAESNRKYLWAETPVKIVEGQKEYDITAVALTEEEWYKKKQDKN